jgi:hypothetical protein
MSFAAFRQIRETMMFARAFQSASLAVSMGLAGLILGPAARAAVTIYATGTTPLPASNYLNEDLSAANGFFDIYVNTDVAVFGLALDVFAQGNAIALTGIEFPTYGGDRWLDVLAGTVAADGKSIQGGGAFTITGTGLDPSAPDGGFNAAINAFHFARVSYDRIGPGASNIWLAIGSNEVGLMSPSDIYLGAGDERPAVASGSLQMAGLRSRLPDGLIGIPGPEDFPLLNSPSENTFLELVEPPAEQLPNPAPPIVVPPVISPPAGPSGGSDPGAGPIDDPLEVSPPISSPPESEPEQGPTLLPVGTFPGIHRIETIDGIWGAVETLSSEAIRVYVPAGEANWRALLFDVFDGNGIQLAAGQSAPFPMIEQGFNLATRDIVGLAPYFNSALTISVGDAFSVSSSAAPEPSSAWSLAIALMGTAGFARRRRRTMC